MTTITVTGIDLAKSVFQLQGNDARGKAVVKRKLSRSELPAFVQQLPQGTIAMEACGGAHAMARRFKSMGHQVRLISPQFVKPYVKGNKNDAADAAAICEAATRPSMHFVPIKSLWHQDVQAIHRARSRLSANRTALANQLRGFLYERGQVTRQGLVPLRKLAAEILDSDIVSSDEISESFRQTVGELLQELDEIEAKIAVYEKRLGKIAADHPDAQRILKVKGIGVITATALLAAVPNAREFKNGRQFAAWLGLVPRHSGTGGKNRLGGISKRGDKYLRCLLVHGARCAIMRSEKYPDALSRWSTSLKDRRGYNKAAVALANKNARIIWAMLARGEEFQMHKSAITD